MMRNLVPSTMTRAVGRGSLLPRLPLALVVLLAPSLAAAQEPFSYRGTVAPGRTVFVRNLNGAVRFEAARGAEVEVEARKRVMKGRDVVRITAEARGGNLLVCAVWTTRETTCDEDGYRVRGGDGWREGNRDEVSVEFTVRVPAGVLVDASTVNGGVDIDGVTARVLAKSVNGSISATSTGGPVRATTVNGSIRATMGSTGTEPLEFETVNGGITLELPADVNAELDARTVNGGIESDFPITVQGSWRRNQLRGTLGKGGPRLTAETVNGGIRIRKK